MKYRLRCHLFRTAAKAGQIINIFMLKQIREAIRVEGGLSEAKRKLCHWKVDSESSSCEEKKLLLPGGGHLRRLLSWLHFMELSTHSCPASAAYVTTEAGGKELLRCLTDMIAAAGCAKSYEADSLAEVC